jgi:hypothetical protein
MQVLDKHSVMLVQGHRSGKSSPGIVILQGDIHKLDEQVPEAHSEL